MYDLHRQDKLNNKKRTSEKDLEDKKNKLKKNFLFLG
jgi:hypothetical protein